MCAIKHVASKINQIKSMLADLKPRYIRLVTTAMKYEGNNYHIDVDPVNDPNGEDKPIIDGYLARVNVVESKLGQYYPLPDVTEPLNESGFESMRYIAKNIRGVECMLRRIKWICGDMMESVTRYEKTEHYINRTNPAIDRCVSRAHELSLELRDVCGVVDWDDYVRVQVRQGASLSRPVTFSVISDKVST